MAQTPQNTSSANGASFNKNSSKDTDALSTAQNQWRQARNASNNTTLGDLGTLSNEASNYLCSTAPYTIIGAIHVIEDQWAIFSTDDVDSEIGLFKEDSCSYETLVNDQCLNFNKDNLIIGIGRTFADCGERVYWDDGVNPTRYLDLKDIPWKQSCQIVDDCEICEDLPELDCNKLRLAPVHKPLSLSISRGDVSGQIINGSYFVAGYYTSEGVKMTNYSLPSNIQAVFTHEGLGGSLKVKVDNADEFYDTFQLVLYQVANKATTAKIIGEYSTSTKEITIDTIFEELPVPPNLGDIFINNAVPDKSEGVFRNGEYAIRLAPTNKFDFNYQPIANNITTRWVMVEYPDDYYINGGSNTAYMKDEQYAYFIRWVYDTGDKTPSFHIPGRAAENGELDNVFTEDVIDADTRKFEVYNTASVDINYARKGEVLPDGGVIISGGKMGYWESTEKYPDDKPEIWGDLCGKPIRHHKMPEEGTDMSIEKTTVNFRRDGDDGYIRILGVEFDNVQPPLDNQGNPIPGIIGYEILRGSRESSKTILVKGVINNMRRYKPINADNKTYLYPNYPYNYLGTDKFLVQEDIKTQGKSAPSYGSSFVEDSTYTFHSPDTNFRNPFLSGKEVKVYGELSGTVNARFQYPENHPKHKLITDVAFIMATAAGIGYATVKTEGKRTEDVVYPQFDLTAFYGESAVLGSAVGGFLASPPALAAFGAATLAVPGITTAIAARKLQDNTLPGLVLSLGGVSGAVAGDIADEAIIYSGSILGKSGYRKTSTEQSDFRTIPQALRFASGAPLVASYVTEGIDNTLDIIYAFTPYRQYALQQVSHCFYDTFKPKDALGTDAGQTRRAIKLQTYLNPELRDFGQYRINNIYRSRTVALDLDLNGKSPFALTTGDNSQFTIGEVLNNNSDWKDEDKLFQLVKRNSSTNYVALKQRLDNQYGQIRSIKQVSISSCYTSIDNTKSEVLFGGDVYIGRYTEKNTMFFFYNWLNGQPHGEEFNYKNYKMITHPKYWMNSEKFDFNTFFNSLKNIFDNDEKVMTPNEFYNMDKNKVPLDLDLSLNKAFFYLFNSGVRDFYVESEINLALRDWGDEAKQRHYDHNSYTNLSEMFSTDNIKNANYYKYDFSLSIATTFLNFSSIAFLQTPSYDPLVAETCYYNTPRRLIYSMPQKDTLFDAWKVFLPNNYKDFTSEPVAIKPINKNGAVILFKSESPVMFPGVDTLVTDGDTKITIGDGGLFSQPRQSLANADYPHEYGSSQNRLSIVNTPAGLFYISQNQGKIFQIGEGLTEISNKGYKWWFAKYLPYKLINQFPDFELVDNPVVGIGCQTVFDNDNQVVYFCKKDYVLRDDISDVVTYVGGRVFRVNNILDVELGDSRYFRNVSWTASYDPKIQGWISFHDWFPDLTLPSKNTFMTIKNNGIWVHNDRCDSFCNFYGVDYPFEIEYEINTKIQVTTLRSITYFMEAYKYAENCYDRFHDLDFNFDEAVVYNTEQCSGLLRLNNTPKNNAPLLVQYPIVNPDSIDILYSKEEQKYRFNQFWDVTDNRGEFDPNAERTIFTTEDNGFIRNLNPLNLNYNKFALERKKFRHYKTRVLFRRNVSGNKNMIVSTTIQFNLNSPR